MNKPKPGLISTNRIQDKASLYQGTSNVASYSQEELKGLDSSAEMQHLMSLVQKLGIDQVQKLLTTEVQAQEEDEEWRQNFD